MLPLSSFPVTDEVTDVTGLIGEERFTQRIKADGASGRFRFRYRYRICFRYCYRYRLSATDFGWSTRMLLGCWYRARHLILVRTLVLIEVDDLDIALAVDLIAMDETTLFKLRQ